MRLIGRYVFREILSSAVLGTLLATCVIFLQGVDKLFEVLVGSGNAAFKTVITLNFVRSWPFVVYALGLLVANLFVYKLFCRFLCPFGAGLALLGRVRLLNWIPRRRDCGSPCQTCRHQCEYQAITPSGRVQYDECFQCMECVVIYASDERCAPLMLEKKRAKVIPIQSNQPNQ